MLRGCTGQERDRIVILADHNAGEAYSRIGRKNCTRGCSAQQRLDRAGGNRDEKDNTK